MGEALHVVDLRRQQQLADIGEDAVGLDIAGRIRLAVDRGGAAQNDARAFALVVVAVEVCCRVPELGVCCLLMAAAYLVQSATELSFMIPARVVPRWRVWYRTALASMLWALIPKRSQSTEVVTLAIPEESMKLVE